MLAKAIPILHDYLTQLSIIDAHILHQQVPVLSVLYIAYRLNIVV